MNVESCLRVLVACLVTSTHGLAQMSLEADYRCTGSAMLRAFEPQREVLQTSSAVLGQIYVPIANWALLVATVLLLLQFRHSGNLAAAYGVAVSTAMLITTLLLYVVARGTWGWRWWTAGFGC